MTSTERAVRGPRTPAPTTPSTLEMLRRQADYWWTVYRRTWKGSVVLSFLQPWLYLAAMGLLLGSYVDGGSSATQLDGAPSYLDFVAPGLLAATASQIGSDESMWPVMGRIRWDRHYHGMIATPLRVRDLVVGTLLYAMARVAFASVAFLLALTVVGVVDSVAGALVAMAGAVLTGIAVSAPIYGYTAGAPSEHGFAIIYRLGIVPMFLFSGAFFPVSNLPTALEWLARVTPLFHGVELCRMATLGTWDAGAALLHVGYLALLALAGTWWGVRRLTRRLVS